ncbi:MAG: DUF5784 family protein [Halobacteriales archaeon]|nr:DUF5784 family protein [Halobacteriales archaeon]
MASPLRFRISERGWGQGEFRRRVVAPLDDKFGVSVERTERPEGHEGRVLRMKNGDFALFAWNGDRGYWTGNTETPEVLWQTNKREFRQVGGSVAEWAEDELLSALKNEAPWLGRYSGIAEFFLPVLMSKDGSETAREFLRTGAGFPDTDADVALSFYGELVSSEVFDGERYTMASKLGTSEGHDRVRMEATMGEFNAAKILRDAGYGVEPEIGMDSGHSLDFLAKTNGTEAVVEVTRPTPTGRRKASTPEQAVRETAGKKSESGGQLRENDGVLFVDCSSFDDEAWQSVVNRKPETGHEPAVVYRTRPGETPETEAYLRGHTRLRLSDAVVWV